VQGNLLFEEEEASDHNNSKQQQQPTSSKVKQQQQQAQVMMPVISSETESELFEWSDLPAAPVAPAPIAAVTTKTKMTVSAPVQTKAVGVTAAAQAPVATTSQSDDLLDFLGGSSSTGPGPSPPPSGAGGVVGMEDFEWGFQSAPVAPVATAAVGGFPGVVGPTRTISPANNAVQNPVKKPSASRLPNELGAEAAKQFTL